MKPGPAYSHIKPPSLLPSCQEECPARRQKEHEHSLGHPSFSGCGISNFWVASCEFDSMPLHTQVHTGQDHIQVSNEGEVAQWLLLSHIFLLEIRQLAVV